MTKPARQTKQTAGAGDPATRQRVIDAAVECILELGFYRASTNAIARQAGVTWGVLQHYFGSRERLMVEVLRHGADQFVASIEDAVIGGSEPRARLEQFIDILSLHYASAEYLVYVQIRLNLDQDPNTSTEIRETMRATAERSAEHIRRIISQALGDDERINQVVFAAVRGFLLGQQLHARLADDTLGNGAHDMDAERRTLAHVLAPYFATAAWRVPARPPTAST